MSDDSSKPFMPGRVVPPAAVITLVQAQPAMTSKTAVTIQAAAPATAQVAVQPLIAPAVTSGSQT